MTLDLKLKQGWLQLLQNTQLFCTTHNVNNVARIKTALKYSFNCHGHHQKHVECQPARMKKDEQAVQDLILCMDDADPFDESVPWLHLLQPRATASPEVLEDLWNTLEEGEKQSNDILEKQVFSKELSLKARITKDKRLNLVTTSIIVTKTCSNGVDMERNALAMVINSVEKNDVIALALVLVKIISEECLTMFNANGSIRKTAKSKLFQPFSRQPLFEVTSAYFNLVDMGLILRRASPTSDDHDAKTCSWPEYLWRKGIYMGERKLRAQKQRLQNG